MYIVDRYLGGSPRRAGCTKPASRAAQSLAASQAIRTWRAKGSMSGASRAANSSPRSAPVSAAWRSALASTWSSAFSMAENTGTEAWYIEIVNSPSRRPCRRDIHGAFSGAAPESRFTAAPYSHSILRQRPEEDDSP